MNMQLLTIVYAALLIVIGLAGKYLTGTQSFTALLPAIFGAVFAALGIGSYFNEKLRTQTMHWAAGLAVLVILGTAGSLIARRASISTSAALAQISVIILTAIYLFQSVKYFLERRKAGKNANPS